MFDRFNRLIDNISLLDSEIIFFSIFSGDRIQKFIIDLNRFEQLFKESETSTGEFLPLYAFDYTNGEGSITYRNSQGDTFTREKSDSDRYFLLDTGALYNSFDVVVEGDEFVITADTVKVEDKKGVSVKIDYNEEYNILGLTDESKQKLFQEITPLVLEQVRLRILS